MQEFGEKSIHKVVELAVKYDKLIDVHCDESDDPMSRFVELLTALSIVEGIGPKTTASHTCSLGSVDNSYAFRMMKNFKRQVLTLYPAQQRIYIFRADRILILREEVLQGLRNYTKMV